MLKTIGRAVLDLPRKYVPFGTGYTERARAPRKGEEANVVCSKLPNGKHAFMLDIDLPCELIESKTPGHYHLYIDIELDQEVYFSTLAALVQCGIVEDGWRRAAVSNGETYLRLPPTDYEYNRLKREMEETGNLFPRCLP